MSNFLALLYILVSIFIGAQLRKWKHSHYTVFYGDGFDGVVKEWMRYTLYGGAILAIILTIILAIFGGIASLFS